MASKGINPACFLSPTNKNAQLPRNRAVIEEKCSMGPESNLKEINKLRENGSNKRQHKGFILAQWTQNCASNGNYPLTVGIN